MNTNMTKWLKRKKDIDEAKMEIAKTEGQIFQLENDLKSRHKCSSTEVAKTKIEKINKQIENEEEKLEELEETVENAYAW